MRTYSRFTRRILSSILAALLCISSAVPAAAAGSRFESPSEPVSEQAADTGIVTSPRSLVLADAAENAVAAASSTSDPDFTFTKVTDTYSTDDPAPNLAITLDLTKYAVIRNYNFSYTTWTDTGYTDGNGNVVVGGSGSGTATPKYRFEVVPVEYLTTGWSVTSVDENRSGVKAGDLLFDREIDIVGGRPFHIEADAVVKKPSDLCLIRFDYDGGALPDGQMDLGGAFFMAGQKIDPNLLPAPVKEGCTFKGWEMSWFDPYELVDKTGVWTSDSILTANTTFKAMWESNAQSMVTLRDLVIDTNNRELVGFTSETTELDIPARFETQNPAGNGKILYTVVGIAEGAFAECDSLFSVSIPDTVASIGSCAFVRCKSLVSVSLPDTLETLGDHAFDGCTALKTVNIPKGISEIRPCTFIECKNLDTVAIPGNVKTIGDNAFNGCECLSIISFEDGLETIGAQAFMDAVGLGGGNGNGRITLPSSLKEIGSGAFCGCVAMSANTEADPFVIPGSVVKIGDMAFDRCLGLTYIRVEDGVRTIGSNVFSGIPDCMVTLPDSLESVADDACDSMCGLHYHGDLANKPFGAGRMIMISYVSNDDGTHTKSCARCGVLSAAETCDMAGTDGACSKCGYKSVSTNSCDHKNIMYTTADAGYVHTGVCRDCGQTVVENETCTCALPNAASNKCEKCGMGIAFDCLTITENNRGKIGYMADSTELTIPRYFQDPDDPGKWYQVETIGAHAFENTKLQKIVISDGVERVGSYSFAYNAELSEIVVPDSITVIDSYAFCGMGHVSSIHIPSGLSYIPDGAYAENSCLTDVTIPSSVTNICDYAFYDDTSLRTVTINGSNVMLMEHAFDGTTSLESVVITGSVLSVGSHVFTNSALPSITFPDGLMEVQDFAFAGAKNLVDINFPDTLETIGDFILVESGSDQHFTEAHPLRIPDSVSMIDRFAFDEVGAIHYHGTSATFYEPPFSNYVPHLCDIIWGAGSECCTYDEPYDYLNHTKTCKICGKSFQVPHLFHDANDYSSCVLCHWDDSILPTAEYSLNKQVLSYSSGKLAEPTPFEPVYLMTAPMPYGLWMDGFDGCSGDDFVVSFDPSTGRLSLTIPGNGISTYADIGILSAPGDKEHVVVQYPRINFNLPAQIPTSGDGWEYAGEAVPPVEKQDFEACLTPYYPDLFDYKVTYSNAATDTPETEITEFIARVESVSGSYVYRQGIFTIPAESVTSDLVIKVSRTPKGTMAFKPYAAGVVAAIWHIPEEPDTASETNLARETIGSTTGSLVDIKIKSIPVYDGRIMYARPVMIGTEQATCWVTLLAPDQAGYDALLSSVEDGSWAEKADGMLVSDMPDGWSDTLKDRFKGDVNNDQVKDIYDAGFLMNVFQGASQLVTQIRNNDDQMIQNYLACDMDMSLTVNASDYIEYGHAPEIETYTLTVDFYGGTLEDGTTLENRTYVKNSNDGQCTFSETALPYLLRSEAPPVKDDLVFYGYSTDPNAVQPDSSALGRDGIGINHLTAIAVHAFQTAEKQTTLYAVYGPPYKTWQISYDAAGGNFGETEHGTLLTKVVSKYSNELSVTFEPLDVTPVRDGYVFLGWAKTEEAAAPDYQPDESVTLTA